MHITYIKHACDFRDFHKHTKNIFLTKHIQNKQNTKYHSFDKNVLILSNQAVKYMIFQQNIFVKKMFFIN